MSFHWEGSFAMLNVQPTDHRHQSVLGCLLKMHIPVSWLKAETSRLSSNMAQDNSPNKTIAMSRSQSCTKFTADELKILIKAFNQKPDKSLLQDSSLKSLESRFGFRIEGLGTESRKALNLKRTWKQVKTKVTRWRRFRVEETDSVIAATLPPDDTPSPRHLRTTRIPGLIPESDLLRKLGFQSRESKFVFKIKDLDSTSREKQNLRGPQSRNKTRNKISDMREFKRWKLHTMALVSGAIVLFL